MSDKDESVVGLDSISGSDKDAGIPAVGSPYCDSQGSVSEMGLWNWLFWDPPTGKICKACTRLAEDNWCEYCQTGAHLIDN
jgi:hypothetical protein